MIPIAEHTEALEIARLAGDLLGGVLAALLPERGGVELVATLPNFFSTASSIGRPWQSQPGT